MSAGAHPVLDFGTPAGRSAFEALRREIDEAQGPIGERAAHDLFDLGALFDNAATRLKRELLASSLATTQAEERLMAWIGVQHREIHQMGFAIAMELRAQNSALLPAAIASSLHHRGQATKWCFGVEGMETSALHELMSIAVLRKREREALICKLDGAGRRTTIEALYLRALLLERFASGELTRPQLEILDAWLWEWGDALRAEREAPVGRFLRVDLDSDVGLREGAREGEGKENSLYLPLDPLERARRAVIAQMQRGRLVPSSGCAADMRIEDHLAVADHLAGAFGASPEGASQRCPRRMARGPRVEVWNGLAEILPRAIGVGSETGRFEKLASSPRMQLNDVSRRYFWLYDESDSGVSFEALQQDAGGIAVGDLLGWRRFPGAPVALGQVARCLPRAGGEVFFGVRIVSAFPQPVKLADAARPDAEAQVRLFIPGADPGGRDDAFLMAESEFETSRTYRTCIGDQEFHLRFNRVRQRARGWLLVGFELVPEGAVSTAEAAKGEPARAAPAAAAAEDEDPWRNEVRGKLLD